jgi:hypothetical protein
MISSPMHRGGEKIQRPDKVKLRAFVAIFLTGGTIGTAIFTGLAGLMLGIPARRLAVPYTALLCCGLVFTLFIYWARLVRDRPKLCAVRLGIGMSFYLLLLALALGYSAIRLHIMPRAEAISYFGVSGLLISPMGFLISYVLLPRVLKAPSE